MSVAFKGKMPYEIANSQNAGVGCKEGGAARPAFFLSENMDRKKMRDALKKRKKKHNRFFRSHAGLTHRRRVKDNWRKERGADNKKRKKEKHRGAEVNIGWRNARELRGIHPSGYVEVMVFNAEGLDSIKEGEAARISAKVGNKKRIEIVNKAKEKGIRILGFSKKREEEMKKKMEERKKKTEPEKEKGKEAKEKKEEKEGEKEEKEEKKEEKSSGEEK